MTQEAKKEDVKKEEPKHEVAKVQQNEIASFESGAWGAGQEITQEDLVVGKILIMQPQSRAVIKGKAKMGEFRGSLDDRLYSNAQGEVDVVVFSQDKVWIVYETVTDNKGKKTTEWRETIPWTLQNAKLPWNEVVDGRNINRQKAFNFYCIVRDKDYAFNLPVIVRMKSTSYTTGRRLSTLFAQLAAQNKPSASKVLTLSCTQQENDQGVFYVWEFAERENTTPEEMKIAYKWYVGMKQSQFKVDESEESGTSTVNDEDSVDFL